MREDDAKSGVGAQRGGGLHKAYIADLNNDEGKGKGSEGKTSTEESSEGGSGEESNASTTSSSLERYFPKRFFILKVGVQCLNFDLMLADLMGWSVS